MVLGRHGLTRADVVVAVGFVLAAAGETLVLHRDAPALLALGLAGAPGLAVLAVRRIRPVLSICVVAGGAVVGTTAQMAFWPGADDDGGVWLLALMFAAYSLGAYGTGRVVALGGLLPLLTGSVIDVPTMRGWALVNGVLFLTAFVGILPTAVGRVVLLRRKRLVVLDQQRDLIVREQQTQREAAVRAERLRATERLRPVLLDGLRALADRADAGVDPSAIELTARQLLGRTREEVVALTGPVEVADTTASSPASFVLSGVDYLHPLRDAAQPWTVLAAGAIGVGIAAEATATLPGSVPPWIAFAAAMAACLPLAFVWWRPLAALAVAWPMAVGFSHLVAPLDGSLSGTAFALVAAFAVAALSTRRVAVVGLALCWLGQLVGVGADDPFGEGVILLVCWLGGLLVNEMTKLVEQSRTNNRLLAGQEAAAQQRAIVEDRLRLARDVHDQIGHTLTVVALQAGAARRLTEVDPARAEEVMTTIAAAAYEGLAAMTGETAPDIGALLRRTRAAGLSITDDLADLDAPGLVDPDTRAVCCRIVQESLTNVLRHAPGAATTVTVRRNADGVSVMIGNGPATGPPAGSGGGRGLAGLQERVAARGGELRWGPRQDGGFAVHAILPVRSLEEVGR